MAKTIIYYTECECGGRAENRVFDATQDKEDIEIDIDFNVFDTTLECNKCGKEYYVQGSIESED